ncbi:hypothetical protein AcW1_010287 [Taiwanofungus camphoratus]|nr:hypothetical protein AcW1_010287 [Antrodia cinnamomea]
MARLPPFWFGYYYPCTHQHSSSDSDITMLDNDTTSEERDTVGDLPDFFPLKFVPISADQQPTRYATPPPDRNAQSDWPTPCKAGMSSLQTESGVTDERVKRFLQREFQGKIARDYPVIDFVREVWGFTPDNLPKHRSIYSLSNTNLVNYMRTTKGERGCYQWLKAMFDELIQQLSLNQPAVSAEFINLRDGKVGGNSAAFKPDFAYGTVNKDKFRQNWEWLGAVGEVKKVAMPTYTQDTDVKVDARMLKNPNNPSVPKRKHPGDDANADEESSKKRRRVSEGTGKKSKTESGTGNALTQYDIQATKYLNELLSHGVRSYATGFLIRETRVYLWYADRMGLVESAGFDFLEQPYLLLLVVAAIRTANLAKLGISPFLRFPPRTYNSYAGAKLVLPSARDLDNEEIKKLHFDIVVDEERRVFTAYGAVGRGTTVVPVKAVGKAKQLWGEEKLVAKIAWPSKMREAEDCFIRKVRKKLRPEYLKHIVDLKCSLTRTMQEMKLPRASMGDLRHFGVDDVEERVCRTLVLKAYSPLELVNGPEEFKDIFVAVVRAHHHVWETSEILHRDISINNIMFYREHGRAVGVLCDWDLAAMMPKAGNTEPVEGDIPKHSPSQNNSAGGDDEDDKGTGKDDDDHVKQCRARYRTGTGPFMALDLLTQTKTPRHLYRFDLESFFYVLVWFCASFDPTRNYIGFIRSWQNDELTMIGNAKHRFLTKRLVYQGVIGRADSCFESLINEWVASLRYLFWDLHETDDRYDRLREDLSNAAGKPGETMAADRLRQLIESRKEVVTYETFMKALGVEP